MELSENELRRMNFSNCYLFLLEKKYGENGDFQLSYTSLHIGLTISLQMTVHYYISVKFILG